MGRWGTVALAAAVILAMVGCGGSSGPEQTVVIPTDPTSLDITLDGYPGPENVGILMAEERGYFEDANLEVWVRTPQSRLRPLPYVVEREVALAVSHQAQVALAQAKGAPVVSVGSLLSKPTSALIWLRGSKIGGPADLEGKTVGFVGLPFEREILETTLAEAGLTLDDVKLRRFDYDLLPALTGGRADAILGSWNIEGAALEARGLRPQVNRIAADHDELVLITRPVRLDEESAAVRRFVAAVLRGNEAAIEDPQAAVNLVARRNAEPATKALQAEVEATLPLLSTADEGS